MTAKKTEAEKVNAKNKNLWDVIESISEDKMDEVFLAN